MKEDAQLEQTMGNKILSSIIAGLLLLAIIFDICLYEQQTNLLDQQARTKKLIEEIKSYKVELPDALKKKIDDTITEYQNDLKQRKSDFEKQVKGNEEQNQIFLKNQEKRFDGLFKAFETSAKTIEEHHKNELGRHLQEIQRAQKEYEKQIANADKTVQVKLDHAITTFTQRISNRANTTFAEIKQENQKQFAQVTQEITLLAKQKISGNEAAARDAYEQAQEYIKKGDWDMARLYCLNAINHAPNQKTYFETLINIDKAKGTAANQAELDGIRSVLELGIYQVDSKDIPAMMEMLAYVNGKSDKISKKAMADQKEEEQKKCAAALALLKKGGKYAWDNSSQGTVEWIRNRLNVLDSLSSMELASKDAAFCREEINKSNVLLGYLVAMSTIDNALTKAEKLLEASDPQFPAISSMVQSSNNVLSQLWNVDFNLLPGNARGKVIAQADRIAKIEKLFNKKKSAPTMAKINQIYQSRNGYLSGNRTQKINALQEGMKEIMQLLPEVYDLDDRRDAENKISVLSDKVKEYSKERYEGYQAWAVKKCNDAFELYRSWTRVDEVDAIEVIERHLLEIDPANLTPAVSRLYQDVLAKQFAEMGWKKIAELESKLATSTKKTIEDCPDEE